MKRFEIPENMKLVSIWVVWGFLAIGVLGWALFVVLDFFEVKKQAASWVQAIGSIAGIAIAIYVPYMQKQHADKVRKDEGIDASIASHYAALTLINHHIELMNRIRDARFGWRTELSELDRSVLADDLQRNKREIESLGIDALGPELVAYLLLVKGVAGFGGFFAEQVMERSMPKRLHNLRVLEFRASSYETDLVKAVSEIEELSEKARNSKLG